MAPRIIIQRPSGPRPPRPCSRSPPDDDVDPPLPGPPPRVPGRPPRVAEPVVAREASVVGRRAGPALVNRAPALATAAERLATLAHAASRQARDSGRPVLVSVVERVAPADPLDALERASAGAADGDAVDRMYWSRPVDGFALAGFGAAATLAPEVTDRFGAVDRAWRALLDGAMIDEAAGAAEGAGPTLMGGFSFEADGPRTPRWRDFPRASLTLPALQLAVVGGEGWLTTNLVVDAAVDIDLALASRAQARERLLDARRPTACAAGTPWAAVAVSEGRPGAEWRAVVGEAVATIRAGALEKVVLAREVHAHAPRRFDVAAAVRRLRAQYRDCWVFALWRGDSAFVGASPERLVRVEGRDVRASSLAGSMRRGATPAEDALLAGRLRESAKDRVEHAVVRDALVGALGELCDDVAAEREPALLTLPQIHHLHTDVRATLRAGRSIFDLVRRLHPTPAVGGQPREAALRFLREHERLDRGWYAAPIGWVGRNGGEFAVGLRSALVTGADASLYAGCGVVADSDADREYAESALKLQPMELALGGAA